MDIQKYVCRLGHHCKDGAISWRIVTRLLTTIPVNGVFKVGVQLINEKAPRLLTAGS
jgi:hypothetical protein